MQLPRQCGKEQVERGRADTSSTSASTLLGLAHHLVAVCCWGAALSELQVMSAVSSYYYCNGFFGFIILIVRISQAQAKLDLFVKYFMFA